MYICSGIEILNNNQNNITKYPYYKNVCQLLLLIKKNAAFNFNIYELDKYEKITAVSLSFLMCLMWIIVSTSFDDYENKMKLCI